MQVSYWEWNSWLSKKCLGNRPLEEKVNMHCETWLDFV